MSTIYENALKELKKKTKNIDINAKTIIEVVRFAMEIVEATTVKGEEQKQLVENLVKQIIVEAPISDDKEKTLLFMINEGIVGDIIDLVVSATKGELNINAVVELSKVCCLGLYK